ncbi:hypothetical protein [Fibrivirga algicola]|uniref:Lipocalin-like domain-containing protein n=1 Tax=Fibrivirga algicola TaxID=2950420 RepID=A0ABX0QDA8_9BACT|nr:hypothetical protein [Fibrivirga algicola]NID09923.1 hypothetical protein [Fibrivirga algicola]
MNYFALTIFTLSALISSLSTSAQSVVGTWQRTGALITYKNGKTMDVQPMMEQSSPCTAKITYSFTAGGVQKTIVPAGCLEQMSAQAVLFADARYTVSGSSIKVISPNPKMSPDVTYGLTMTGNTMTWVMNFDDFPAVPNPGKARSMTFTYKRL